MIRRLLFITALLVIGLAINLGLAWAAAAWVGPANRVPVMTRTDLGDGRTEVETRLRQPGLTRVNRAVLLQFETNALSVTTEWDMNEQTYSAIEAGWPMRAFECRNYADIELRMQAYSTAVSKTGMNPIIDGIVLSSFATGGPAMSWRALPYRPLWAGLVVNTLAFALLVWLLFFAGFWWRRRSRVRRRLCLACGYPIGESPVCTECGAAVSGEPVS